MLTQVGRGLLGVLGSPNDAHDLVDIVYGDLQPLEDMLALARHPQAVFGTPNHHRVPMIDELRKNRLEVHHPGNATHQGQHDDAERALHLGVLVQLVEHDLGDGVTLDVDHHPDALPSR